MTPATASGTTPGEKNRLIVTVEFRNYLNLFGIFHNEKKKKST